MAIIIARAEEDDQVLGPIPPLVEGGFLLYNMSMILLCL
jgi:hypothetical protein